MAYSLRVLLDFLNKSSSSIETFVYCRLFDYYKINSWNHLGCIRLNVPHYSTVGVFNSNLFGRYFQTLLCSTEALFNPISVENRSSFSYSHSLLSIDSILLFLMFYFPLQIHSSSLMV
jgi:hypothetical protein